MSSDECVITFPVVGGIFGVAPLATKLNELLDGGQIGPSRIGQWIDFKHTAIRIRFLTGTDGEVAKPASAHTEEGPVTPNSHVAAAS